MFQRFIPTRRLGVLAAATVAVASPLAPREGLAQTERRTLAGASVAIWDVVGRVQVEPGTGSDVVVEIARLGRDARELTIEVGELRGRPTLRVIFPDDQIVYPELGRWSNSSFSIGSDGTWGRDDRSWYRRRQVRVRGSGRGLEAWADLRILVPAGKQVEVNLGVGELEARRVEADLTLDAASGRVTATGTKGRLSIDTGSGSIEVRGATGDELAFDTGSGRITVSDLSAKRCTIETGSGSVSGGGLTCDELSIDVGSGGIRVSDAKADRIRLDTGSGSIDFSVLTSPKSLDVDSGSGSVTVSLPANLNADVEIDTGSGGIDTDFPLQVRRIERRHVRGTVGDGSGRIRIETGSGSVHLRKN